MTFYRRIMFLHYNIISKELQLIKVYCVFKKVKVCFSDSQTYIIQG